MQQRMLVTMQVQRMMLEIMTARHAAQIALTLAEGDGNTTPGSSDTARTEDSSSEGEASIDSSSFSTSQPQNAKKRQEMMPWRQPREEADWMPPD